MLLIIFALTTVTMFAEECPSNFFSSNSEQNLISLSRKCLQISEFSKNNDEFQNTIPKVKQLLTNYARLDVAKYPPQNSDFLGVDIMSMLDEIDQKEYASAQEFYEAIMLAVQKLGDPNTYFEPPCSNNMSYSLPFGIRMKCDDYDKPDSCHIFGNASSHASCGRSLLKDLEITKIKLDGSEITDEDEPASITIARWAEDNINPAFSPVGKMNKALFGDFTFRPATKYALPKNDFITVEYIDENGVTKIEQIEYCVECLGESCYHIPNNCNLRSESNQINQPRSDTKPQQSKSQFIPLNQMIHSNLSQEIKNQKKHKQANSYNSSCIQARKSQVYPALFYKDDIFYSYSKDLRVGQIIYLVDEALNSDIPYVALNMMSIEDDKATNQGSDMAWFFFKYFYPHYSPKDMAKTPLNRIFQYYMIYPYDQYDKQEFEYLNGSSFKNWYDSEGVNRQYGRSSREMTQKVIIDFKSDQFYQYENKSYRKRQGLTPFENNDMIIITDGICTGVCARFLNIIIEQDMAKVVLLGYNPLYPNSLNRITAGVDGDFKMSSDQLVDMRRFINNGRMDKYMQVGNYTYTYDELLGSIPSNFSRESVRITWSTTESYNHQQRNVLQDYSPIPKNIIRIKNGIQYYQEHGEYGLNNQCSNSFKAVNLGKLISMQMTKVIVCAKDYKLQDRKYMGANVNQEYFPRQTILVRSLAVWMDIITKAQKAHHNVRQIKNMIKDSKKVKTMMTHFLQFHQKNKQNFYQWFYALTGIPFAVFVALFCCCCMSGSGPSEGGVDADGNRYHYENSHGERVNSEGQRI